VVVLATEGWTGGDFLVASGVTGAPLGLSAFAGAGAETFERAVVQPPAASAITRK
jgi:hypothetical protein